MHANNGESLTGAGLRSRSARSSTQQNRIPSTAEDMPRQFIQPHTIGVHPRVSLPYLRPNLFLAVLPPSSVNALTQAV
jgi:hypothetical protein